MVPSFLINIPQPPLLSWWEWVKTMMTTRNEACMKQFCETGTWSPPCTVEKPEIAHHVLSPVRPRSFYSTPNPWLHRKPSAEWWHFVAVSIQQFSMSLNGLPGECKLDTPGKSKKTWRKEIPWNQKMGMKNTEWKLQRAGEGSSSREEALWHHH
jgi:hypothetical protein